MIYNIDITESPARDGTFSAICRENGHVVPRSANPEQAMARVLVVAGCPDGQMQTWRGTTPSLLYKSIAREAARRASERPSRPPSSPETPSGDPKEPKEPDAAPGEGAA